MNRTMVFCAPILLGLVGGVTGCGAEQTLAAATIPSNAQVVHVKAKNFQWTLDKTIFTANVPIDFVIQTTDYTHGFSIVQTKVNRTINAGDAPVNIVWTPPSAGQYTIRCNVFCGSGHDNMFETIRVQ